MFHTERQTQRNLQKFLCSNRPQMRLFPSTCGSLQVSVLLELHSDVDLVTCYLAPCYDFA
jgi:hypothetical protein